MADEAIGGDLESPARSRSGGSVHGSQDRGRADLASHSAPNRSRSSEHAARFENATPAGISRGLESGTGFNTVMTCALSCRRLQNFPHGGEATLPTFRPK